MQKLLILFITALFSCTTTPEKHVDQQVLLISFDGFRADYLSKTETPNFDKLTKNGVTSEGLIPIFPTKTFPNHYAIATGLYPENNGIVGNNMYDPEMDKRYSIGNREAVENPDWYWGEPIWNTVEKAGKKAGTMFWVGSEAPIQNMRPTHWKRYDGDLANEARIDTVLKWMTNEKAHVDLGTLYFSFVDDKGHNYGPDSEEVIKAIEYADSLIGYLTEKLQELDATDNINMIIVSDHGMINLSPDKKVLLDDLVDVEKLDFIAYSPVVTFNIQVGFEEEVYTALKEGQENYKVYSKADIPERFHLKNNRRIPDMIMVADEGYTINTKEYFNSKGSDYPSGATHGFDNANPKMHALFVAHGPAFKRGVKLAPFENIHLYEVMAKILNVKPAPNDGDLKEVIEILK